MTASASGPDPHISLADARLQAPRVAAARGLDAGAVLGLGDDNTSDRGLGFLGEPGVDVLQLNLALDELGARLGGAPGAGVSRPGGRASAARSPSVVGIMDVPRAAR